MADFHDQVGRDGRSTEGGKTSRLRAEVERLTAMIEERDTRLAQLIDQQKNLVRNLSHDLKTPLTPLIAILPLMRSQVDDAELREMLDVVIDSVGYIHAIVEQTLELAHVSTRDFKAVLGEVDLRSILDGVLARYSFTDDAITLRNGVNEEILVKAHSLLLDEILDNLVSNAVKFMGGPGVITIEAERMADEVVVTVSDTGLGMTDDEVAHVFDEFFKADTARHDLASTGLGMSKCKHMVEKLGGKITVTSQGKGCGVTVCFSLNLAEGAAR